LYGVAKRFQELVNPQKEVAANSAFIVDDTIDERVGYKIENITTVHDHVAGKKGSKYGFLKSISRHKERKWNVEKVVDIAALEG